MTYKTQVQETCSMLIRPVFEVDDVDCQNDVLDQIYTVISDGKKGMFPRNISKGLNSHKQH